jgi:hypothetical protein
MAFQNLAFFIIFYLNTIALGKGDYLVSSKKKEDIHHPARI